MGEREQRKMRGKGRFECCHFEVFEVALGLLAVTGVTEIVFITMSLKIRKKSLFTHPLSLTLLDALECSVSLLIQHIFTKSIFEEE